MYTTPIHLQEENAVDSMNVSVFFFTIFGCVHFQDPAKRQFADELIEYADAFTKVLYAPLISKVDMSDEAGKDCC
jgi:hypothetical protein